MVPDCSRNPGVLTSKEEDHDKKIYRISPNIALRIQPLEQHQDYLQDQVKEKLIMQNTRFFPR